jgi:hypothetical protein
MSSRLLEALRDPARRQAEREAVRREAEAEEHTFLSRVIARYNGKANSSSRSHETVPMDIDPPFDAAAQGMKEIGNLASWTVSSFKPGCGVEALRDEDTGLFWQCVISLLLS